MGHMEALGLRAYSVYGSSRFKGIVSEHGYTSTYNGFGIKILINLGLFDEVWKSKEKLKLWGTTISTEMVHHLAEFHEESYGNLFTLYLWHK